MLPCVPEWPGFSLVFDGWYACRPEVLVGRILADREAVRPVRGPDYPQESPVASFKDLFKSDVAKGVAIGIGIVALSPVVVPVVAKLSRPTARAAARYGNVLYDKGLETFAEMGEILEDFAAEVKAEFVQARQQAAEAAPPSPASVSPTQAPSTIPDPD